MDEQELLIQRFLDQDLSPDERMAFLRAVDADSKLRRQWLNVERVMTEVAHLRRIVPSARFFSEMKQKLEPPPFGLWQRLWATVIAPRTLEWNVAGALAAACIAIVAVGGLFTLVPERIVEVPVAAGSAQTVAVVANQETKVFVRLVLLQPGAHSVSVAGDFNGWNPAQTPLERSDGGMWTATIPLKPGRYQYMFVIDGKQWIADPLAAEEETDGFGAQNAVLDVAI